MLSVKRDAGFQGPYVVPLPWRGVLFPAEGSQPLADQIYTASAHLCGFAQ